MFVVRPRTAVRGAVLAAMSLWLLATALLPGNLATNVRSLAPGTALAAPAQVQLGQIEFSPAVDPLAYPVVSLVQFRAGTDVIWASFDFDQFNGEQLSYMLLANGEQFQWGSLDCCAGPGGRYAFPIRRPSGRLLGGAAYKLIIFANKAPVAEGGFGINGTGGFDNNDND